MRVPLRIYGIVGLFFLLGIVSIRATAKPARVFTHRFAGDFMKKEIDPQEYLLASIKKSPNKESYILYFNTVGPMDLYATKVNFLKRQKVLYLYTERLGWSKSLTRYSGVTPQKIKASMLFSKHLSRNSAGNFDSLDSVGCVSKVVWSKTIAVSGG